MKTVTEIVTALGGRSYVARALGLSEGAIRQWENDNLIPERRIEEVLFLSIVKDAGVTVAALMGVTRRKAAPDADAPQAQSLHIQGSPVPA